MDTRSGRYADSIPDGGEVAMPLAGEEVSVTKRLVETRRIGVHRLTREHEEVIAEPVTEETVEITRVPVGRELDAVPSIRVEGDTVVIPVLEERLVVERRLVLKEEVHVRRVRRSTMHRENVTLRRHEVVLSDVPAGPADVPGHADREPVEREIPSSVSPTGEPT